MVVELIVEVWLRSSTAMGVWSMWTLAHTGVNGDPIVKDVVTRVKYFYVVTLVLNVRGPQFCVHHETRLTLRRSSARPSSRSRSGVSMLHADAPQYCKTK